MTMTKANEIYILLLFLTPFFFVGCNDENAPYKKKLQVKVSPLRLEIMRYEKAFFEADTVNFADAVKKMSNDYSLFLDGDLSDPEVLSYLRDFATDPFAQTLYQKVSAKYPTDESVGKHIGDVVARINYFYPDSRLSGKVYTCVLGLEQFATPVFFDNHDDVIVSLDYYLDDDEVYARIGMPQYRSLRTYGCFIPRDMAMEYYKTYLETDSNQGTLLDDMLKAGKQLFFVEAVNPDMPDTVLVGYTSNQMSWIKESEADVWRDIVGSNKLYSSQREMFMMMLNDGPFTQQYSYDAPSRIGEYIGLQIIRSYMSRNDVSLQELIANNDLQGIFNESGYRPKHE